MPTTTQTAKRSQVGPSEVVAGSTQPLSARIGTSGTNEAERPLPIRFQLSQHQHADTNNGECRQHILEGGYLDVTVDHR